MIHVIADIEIKEGMVEEFLKIFKANIPRVLEEEGCIEYIPTVDTTIGNPNQNLNSSRVTIVEKWQNTDCLLTHLKAPHMLVYREKVQDLIANISMKVLQQA